jgi:K+-sensing histidine kinase KdpD
MVGLSTHQIKRLLRERSAIAEIVNYLSSATATSISLDSVMAKIMEVIEPAETGLIFLWDDASGLLRPSVVVGYDPDLFKDIDLMLSESIPGEIFTDGTSRLITSPNEITKAVEDMRPANLDLWQQALGKDYLPKNMLAAAISKGNLKHGVLVLEILDGIAQFTEQDQAFLQLIAGLISLCMERNGERIKETVSLIKDQVRTGWVETLSHELSMPLTAIKGYATALLLEDVEWSLTKRKEFLQLIEDECDLMETLLSELLNSAIIDMDGFNLEPETIRLSQIAHEIAEEMERRTDKHHLIVDLPSNLPVIEADPRWIKQVFRNLLDNAIKFSPDGGLIVIRGEVRSTNVVISISDQGIGMPPEDLILIFDKYEHTKSLEGMQIPGTGLGLPIARSIIEAHGGRIWVDSTINQGSTLSFSLPQKRISRPELEESNEPRTHSNR